MSPISHHLSKRCDKVSAQRVDGIPPIALIIWDTSVLPPPRLPCEPVLLHPAFLVFVTGRVLGLILSRERF